MVVAVVGGVACSAGTNATSANAEMVAASTSATSRDDGPAAAASSGASIARGDLDVDASLNLNWRRRGWRA